MFNPTRICLRDTVQKEPKVGPNGHLLTVKLIHLRWITNHTEGEATVLITAIGNKKPGIMSGHSTTQMEHGHISPTHTSYSYPTRC